jgi:acetyl esterase/lipase
MMRKLAWTLGSTSALLAGLTLLQPDGRAGWLVALAPRALAGGVAPLLALSGGAGLLMGLARRDLRAVGLGLVGTTLAAQHISRVTRSHDGFAEAFGPDWQDLIPESLRDQLLPRRWTPILGAPAVSPRRDVPYGTNPDTGQPLLADIWQPPESLQPSGLGIIYVHGGGWRAGARDAGTRPLFSRLASQGHLVLDIDYTLSPLASLVGMVGDVKRAILWLKDNAEGYGVRPDRIVLMGGSAGGHLALLAAYTPDHPQLQPDGSSGDTSVRAVVAFYPPPDLEQAYRDVQLALDGLSRWRGTAYFRAVEQILRLIEVLSPEDQLEQYGNHIGRVVGGTPDEMPEYYRLLSPSSHVGPHCPPTLLLQGAGDVFGMAPAVDRLHQALRQAGVPSVLVRFPNTEHSFDLVLPQVSPAAQAAFYDLDRFLALMVP